MYHPTARYQRRSDVDHHNSVSCSLVSSSGRDLIRVLTYRYARFPLDLNRGGRIECGSLSVGNPTTLVTSSQNVLLGAVSGTAPLTLNSVGVANATSWTGSIALSVFGGCSMTIKSGPVTFGSLSVYTGNLVLFGPSQGVSVGDVLMTGNSGLVSTNALPVLTTRAIFTTSLGLNIQLIGVSFRVATSFAMNVSTLGSNGNATVILESKAELVASSGILVDGASTLRPVVIVSRTATGLMAFDSSAGFSFTTPSPQPKSVHLVVCYSAETVLATPAVVVQRPAV